MKVLITCLWVVFNLPNSGADATIEYKPNFYKLKEYCWWGKLGSLGANSKQKQPSKQPTNQPATTAATTTMTLRWEKLFYRPKIISEVLGW